MINVTVVLVRVSAPNCANHFLFSISIYAERGTVTQRNPNISKWTPRLFRANCTVDQHGCWIWQRTRTTQGYGVLHHKKRRWLAHRFAVLLYGKCSLAKLERNVVLHACDRGTQGCVNPKHLNVGTQWDNVQDCRLKRRYRHPKQKD